MLRVWTEVLGAEPPDRTTDFFDLGGDSILVIRLVSRVTAAFGVELSPRDIFDNPTIATLSDAVRRLVFALAESTTTAGHQHEQETRS
jgi:acyl carrier protein